MNIYEELKNAGCEIGNHESDLYVKVSPESTAIVDKYEHRKNVSTFTSQVDGAQWYDIPFAYQPFWDKVESHPKAVAEREAAKKRAEDSAIEAGHRVIIKRALASAKLDREGWDHAALDAWAIANPELVAPIIVRWMNRAADAWVAGNNSGNPRKLEEGDAECDRKRNQAESVLALFGVTADYPGLYPVYGSAACRHEEYAGENLGRYLKEVLAAKQST